MKKMILAAALFAATASCAVAQDNNFESNAGDFSLEVQFNPFSNDFGTFKLDQIKGRYFFTGKDAVRFGIGFGLDNYKNTPDPEDHDDIWNKGKSGFFSINLGYERHFFSYKRVDLYAGLGLGYKHDFASSTESVEIDNNIYENKHHNICDGKRTGNFFNVNVFTGIDFYLYKGLFVGAELGIKLETGKQPGTWSETWGYNDNGILVLNESKKANENKTLSLKTYVEPALRLGWTF